MKIIVATVMCLWALFAPGDAAVQIVNQRDICLRSHNALRALHTATNPLQWDYQLQRDAEVWARKLAIENAFYHDENRNGVGENIFSGTAQCPYSCAKATLDWYNEINLYSYSSPGFSMSTGHFTQVVWTESTKLGVGIAVADQGGMKRTVIVARYKPSGNFGFRKDYIRCVKPRTSGSRAPSIGTLDPNYDKPCGPCKDRHQQCSLLVQWMNICNNKPLAKYNCLKTCKFC